MEDSMVRSRWTARFEGRKRRTLACLLVIFVPMALAASAQAGFSNIINVPPAVIDSWPIHPDTQVNVYEDGTLPWGFILGYYSGSSSHIELNVNGGSVADFLQTGSWFATNSDIVVNLFSGEIGNYFYAASGTTVNVYGGSIGDQLAAGNWI